MIQKIKFDDSERLWELLLLADPDRELIKTYINQSDLFIFKDDANKISGLLVLKKVSQMTYEIMNLAVNPNEQGRGIGFKLIDFVINNLSLIENFPIDIIVKTGDTSKPALKLYQKADFKIVRIEENYFLDHYSEPIFEDGEQLKHQVILSRKIDKNRMI